MGLPTSELEIVRAYKQAKRKEDDIAIVNACFKVRLQRFEEKYRIESLDLTFGGLAPTTNYLEALNSKFKGNFFFYLAKYKCAPTPIKNGFIEYCISVA